MKLFSKKQPTSPKAYRTQGPSNKTNIPLSTGKPFGFKAKSQIPGDIGAASASSSSSAAADGIYEHEYDDDYNEGEEKELDECFKFTEVTVAHNGIIVINTTAMFFKEVESSIEKDREARVKKRSHRRTTSRSSMGSLDSIDEDRELDNDEYVSERKVRITTMLVPHDGEKCARFVANHLHKEIVEHPAFTSITTMPVVFRDAFVTTDDAFMKSTDNDDESGCSAITTVITSNNSICVAHIGDVRGIIQGTDGTIAELSPGHMIAKSPKEKNRLGKAGVYISSDQKIFGKLPYSRAFGHKTLKDVLPEGLICLPNIIQIQMNFASSGNDNGNTINSKSSIADDASTRFDSESHASLKSQSRKGKREDVILAIGSASSWSNTTDKKLCSTIAGSLFKGESVLETIENNILSTKPSAPSAMSMFKKHTETVQDTAPKGMCIVNWTRYV